MFSTRRAAGPRSGVASGIAVAERPLPRREARSGCGRRWGGTASAGGLAGVGTARRARRWLVVGEELRHEGLSDSDAPCTPYISSISQTFGP